MSIAQMRAYVIEAYRGDRWKHKVNNMADRQVMAIYFRLVEARRK